MLGWRHPPGAALPPMAEHDDIYDPLPLSELPPKDERSVGAGAISEIQPARDLFPALIEAVPAAVVVVDDLRRVVVANAATRRLLRAAHMPYLGYSISRILSEERLRAAAEELTQSARDVVTYQDHLVIDGTTLDVVVQVTRLVRGQGAYYCMTLQDCTMAKRERAEWDSRSRLDPAESMRLSHGTAPPAERLRQAHRFETLGHLTGSMAHEFNNLLSVIISSLELAKRAHVAGEDPREDIDRATLAADRSAETIGHILRYSRRRQKVGGVIRPAAVLHELRGLMERTLPRHTKLKLVASTTARVRAEASRLETAILNLVINARDAVSEGGEVAVVAEDVELGEIDAIRFGVVHGKYVSIRVIDDGMGIPEEIRNEVFEPFFTTKGPAEGTGLGLSTVRSFVHEVGGSVRIESAVGAGTMVELLLPHVRGE